MQEWEEVITTKIEIRSDQVILDGYVNAAGRESRVMPSMRGKFVEVVEPGTFGKALQRNDNIELRFNHTKVLGSTKDGALQLFEDNIGLRAIATVTDTDVMEKARNKELRGWSFGFYANKDTWEDTGKGYQRRFLEDIDLKEVSILAGKTPAYIATSIEQRGEDEAISETRYFEDAAEVTDNAPKPEIPAETRDFSICEAEIQILKLRGKKI